MLILLGWEKLFPAPKNEQHNAVQQTPSAANTQTENKLSVTTPITVTTDTVKAVIDEKVAICVN